MSNNSDRALFFWHCTVLDRLKFNPPDDFRANTPGDRFIVDSVTRNYGGFYSVFFGFFMSGGGCSFFFFFVLACIGLDA
jgi:hypothetical protein